MLTDYNKLLDEINNEAFSYVVPDFRLNKCYHKLKALTDAQKIKLNFYVMNAAGLNAMTVKPAMKR